MMVEEVRTKFGFVFQNLKSRCSAWDLGDREVTSTGAGPRLLAYFVALLILLNSATYLHAGDAIDDYNVAVALFRQSRWNQAAEQFRGFLKDHEKHEKAPLARLYLGLTLIESKDFKEARDVLRKFAAENRQSPNIGQARYRIGECSYLMDDVQSARTELEAFVRDYPNDPLREHALPYLGDAQLRLNDAAAALKMFDQSIEKFPTGALIEDAKFGRARSLESLKRYDDAIREFQEIAARKDGIRAADAQFHLGASYFEREQFDDAIAAYTAIAKDFPQSPLVPAAQLNAGYALYKAGRFRDAAQQFELASKEKSQQPTAGYWLGRSLKSLGEYSKALESLNTAAKSASKHSLAESILFEQALCERYLQHLVEARKLFDQVISRNPTGDLADDSLHALIEMSIESGDFAAAEQYLTRFPKEFPQSGLRLHIELLSGRLDLARAGQKLREKKPTAETNGLYDSAARRFEQVMKQSTIAKTKGQARYYLALARQLQGNQDLALELIAPLVEKAIADGEKSDFSDAIVLQADSLYQQQKYELAGQSAAKYLELLPKGRQVPRALSIQALSAERQKQHELSQSALFRLQQEFADHPLIVVTLQQLAELAESQNDWDTARSLYETSLRLEKDPEKKAYALRGIALAQYERAEYAKAAETFGRVISEFPKHKLVMECMYYKAESLKRADQPDQAMALFQKIFDTFQAAKPAASGAELQPPLEFSFKAGLQVARILNKADKIAEADAAYEELLRRFPQPADLDKRLDEWAILNYRHERFERSDVIWRRLVNEAPNSPLVNSAKLSLAESDLFASKFDEARLAFEVLAESEKSTDEIKEQALFQLVVLAVERQRWSDVRTIGNKLVTKFPMSVHRFYVAYSQAESLLASSKPTAEELVAAREKLQFLQSESADEKVSGAEWFDRIWVLLAEVNFREKKYADVVAIVEDLKQRRPESRFLYLAEEVLGRSYKQQAPPKFDDARAAFERVLSNPAAHRTETAAKAQFMIGDTFFFQEKWDSASIAYQKVYSNYKFPEWQAAALLSAGKCDEAQGHWKLAAETYKLLIKEFPTTSAFDEAKKRLDSAQKKSGA